MLVGALSILLGRQFAKSEDVEDLFEKIEDARLQLRHSDARRLFGDDDDSEKMWTPGRWDAKNIQELHAYPCCTYPYLSDILQTVLHVDLLLQNEAQGIFWGCWPLPKQCVAKFQRIGWQCIRAVLRAHYSSKGLIETRPCEIWACQVCHSTHYLNMTTTRRSLFTRLCLSMFRICVSVCYNLHWHFVNQKLGSKVIQTVPPRQRWWVARLGHCGQALAFHQAIGHRTKQGRWFIAFHSFFKFFQCFFQSWFGTEKFCLSRTCCNVHKPADSQAHVSQGEKNYGFQGRARPCAV